MSETSTRRRIAPVLALVSLTGLAACGKAAVVLQPVTSGDGAASVAAASRGAVPVALPISRVTVTRAPAAGEGATTAAGRRVAVVPTASRLRFLAAPYSDFTSRNVLAIRTVQNSQVPISVGNVFTDQTVARIEQIGSVISMAVRIAAFGPRGCSSAELPEFLADFESGAQVNAAAQPVPGAANCFAWRIAEAGAPVADGSITRAQFEQMLAGSTGQAAQFWPVPACRSVRFIVTQSGVEEPVISAALTVADPDRVHLYPLPTDGTLAMHPICGADLTDKPADRWSAVFAAMAAIDAQVQAVAKQQQQ